MSYFFYKLISPRATFPADMTEAEQAVMQQHFAYWARLIGERSVVAYGPVLDPAGTYGMAVLDVVDETMAQDIGKKDPAIVAGIGFRFDLYPMPDALVRQ
jgi:hypothetical protein